MKLMEIRERTGRYCWRIPYTILALQLLHLALPLDIYNRRLIPIVALKVVG